MKHWVNETSSWWSMKLMKHPVDETIISWNIKLIKIELRISYKFGGITTTTEMLHNSKACDVTNFWIIGTLSPPVIDKGNTIWVNCQFYGAWLQSIGSCFSFWLGNSLAFGIQLDWNSTHRGTYNIKPYGIRLHNCWNRTIDVVLVPESYNNCYNYKYKNYSYHNTCKTIATAIAAITIDIFKVCGNAPLTSTIISINTKKSHNSKFNVSTDLQNNNNLIDCLLNYK